MTHPPHHLEDRTTESRGHAALFATVGGLLLAAGWVANHFAALLPAIRAEQGPSPALLDGVFGVYAVGLLPGLIGGGRTSDALGRFPVAAAGALVAIAGTSVMVIGDDAMELLIGRLIVGVGVGLAISACTAWASDLRGPLGAASAGAALSTGFAVGPFVSGVIASPGPSGIRVALILAAAVVAVALTALTVARRRVRAHPAASPPRGGASNGQSTSRALWWALPLAPWVFASVTLAFVVLPAHIHTTAPAPLTAGVATLVAVGAGVMIQVIARARDWGPQAGTVGASLAAVGYLAAAVEPGQITVWVALPIVIVLGCAYGLCLREGLLDLEAAAPQANRGTLTGLFYVITYIGFGLPLLLTVAGSRMSQEVILGVMAAAAVVAAAFRWFRLRSDRHRRP